MSISQYKHILKLLSFFNKISLLQNLIMLPVNCLFNTRKAYIEVHCLHNLKL